MTDQGVLSGKAILAAIENGSIRIDPFNPKFMNPASFDLTLGEEVRVYSNLVNTSYNSKDGSKFKPRIDTLMHPHMEEHVLDSRLPNPTESFKIGDAGWVLRPGIGYLMHTRESVWSGAYIPVLDGKSSIGRLFTQVHITAGYGDPGFHGNFTLEVVVTHPVRVYAGMRFCQIRFHTVAGEVTQYEGRYKGTQAVGAIASRSWEQFEDQ
jgi:dCTP deaminase